MLVGVESEGFVNRSSMVVSGVEFELAPKVFDGTVHVKVVPAPVDAKSAIPVFVPLQMVLITFVWLPCETKVSTVSAAFTT